MARFPADPITRASSSTPIEDVCADQTAPNLMDDDLVKIDQQLLARVERDIVASRATIEHQIATIGHLERQGIDSTIHREVLKVFRMWETAQLNHRELLRSEIKNEPPSAELRNRARIAIAESRRLVGDKYHS